MYCCHRKFGGVESRAYITRANTGGFEELTYMATRQDAKERMEAWTVAVIIAGGMLSVIEAEDSTAGRPNKMRDESPRWKDTLCAMSAERQSKDG